MTCKKAVLFFFCWWRSACFSFATAEVAALSQYETNTHTHTHTHTHKTQLHTTVNANWPKQTTNEAGRSQRLLQHGQFPDKNYRYISRDIWNFRRFWKLSFIYSTISRGTPNYVVRSPGWRTPKSNTKTDNAHVVRTQNSTQIYLCKYIYIYIHIYTHTHQWKHTYACINTTHTHICMNERSWRGGVLLPPPGGRVLGAAQ